MAVIETNAFNPYVPGMGTDDRFASEPHTGWMSASGKHHPRFLGQTASTLAGSVANQGCGTVAIGALAAGATTTITITDSHITATSFIQCQIARCTTTAQAGAVATLLCSVRVPGSGSVVVDVTNLGSAATISTDYQLWYQATN